jgi:predicted nucleic acid-binding Zn ribbon protein
VFKGSGWYINDSRTKSSATPAGTADTSKKSDDKAGSAETTTEKSTPVAATSSPTTAGTESKTAKAAAD